AGYLTSYTETDPVFGASAANGITSGQVTNWETAYGWGNHAAAGYLKSYTETDPVFSASAANGITSGQVTNWDTAYSWGNHAAAGYLTSYTETDPQVGANVTGYVPRWDGTALISGTVYDDGTNVGIGTSSPSSKLHVYGGGLFQAADAGIFIGPETSSGVIGYYEPNGSYSNIRLFWAHANINGALGVNVSGTPGIDLALDEANTGLDATYTGKLDIYANGSKAVSVRDNLVGIGTTSPVAGLHATSYYGRPKYTPGYGYDYSGCPTDTCDGDETTRYTCTVPSTTTCYDITSACYFDPMFLEYTWSYQEVDCAGNHVAGVFDGHVAIGATDPQGNDLRVNGTAQIDTRLGVGKAPNTAYALDVNGKVNIEGTNPSLNLVGENKGGIYFEPITDGLNVAYTYQASGSSGNISMGDLHWGWWRLKYKLGVNTDGEPVDTLDVKGDIRVGTGTTGCVKDRDGTVIAGTCSSDARLKKDITPFDPVLDKLSGLRPVNYRWRTNEFPDRHFGNGQSYGLIAQEVEKVMPDLVTEDEDGYKAVRYSKLPLVLLEAVRELKTENDMLRARIERLEHSRR
ncbi:MAG: tail fiber domain-containing protein, partial [Deltaproteobacteria bacterium]|nr:tail fiber domain-containing protein [Deltaproteobacteria bacterium]